MTLTAWREADRIYVELGREPGSSGSSLSHQLAVAERRATRRAKSMAGDFLCVFDQAIWVLQRLHGALASARARCGKPYVIVPITLSAAAAVQAAAIRRLYLSGFAPVAAGLVRTLIETLDLALVASYDKEFASDYHAAEDDDQARRFWHRFVARGALERRLHGIERKLGFRDDQDSAPWAWRRDALAELSRDVHPTAVSALFQFTAVDKAGRLRLSLLGQADLRSCRLLVLMAEAVMQFSGMLLKPVVSRAPLTRHPRSTSLRRSP